MLSENAKRRITGHLPQKRDIVDWSSEKILALIKFADFFTENGKFAITLPNVEAANRRALEEDHLDEFMARINVRPGYEGGTIKKFSNRFLSMVRVPLSYLKDNPHAVTEEMYELMVKSPRMDWAVKAFKAVETEMGVQIVLRDQSETTDANRSNPTHGGEMTTPLVKFENAKLALLTLMNQLVKGISQEEIKKMSAKDRIAAFDRLLNTATKMMGAGRPSTVIFQNINTNKAGRAELEKAVLGYSETQQIESE